MYTLQAPFLQASTEALLARHGIAGELNADQRARLHAELRAIVTTMNLQAEHASSESAGDAIFLRREEHIDRLLRQVPGSEYATWATALPLPLRALGLLAA